MNAEPESGDLLVLLHHPRSRRSVGQGQQQRLQQLDSCLQSPQNSQALRFVLSRDWTLRDQFPCGVRSQDPALAFYPLQLATRLTSVLCCPDLELELAFPGAPGRFWLLWDL